MSARRRADAKGGILEPKGLAPAKVTKQIELKVGVARDALKVAVQAGDILLHISPAGARETAQALLMGAQTVEALQARHDQDWRPSTARRGLRVRRENLGLGPSGFRSGTQLILPGLR